MLANILAIAVGLGSFAVYMAAFFFPEVHRKNDFFWSGVGFFYALILWLCAGRITGAVLLGQVASVALLSWFGWQTLYLRRAVTPASQQTPVPPKLQKQASSLLAVQAEDQSIKSAPAMPTFNQSSVAVQTPPEPEETEPVSAPVSLETPEVLEEVPPAIEPDELEVETQPISETEIPAEKPTVEPPEPAPVSETEIEFEDEILEEKTETTSQPPIPTAPPEPQRLSRLFRRVTGLFNRPKQQPPTPVSPIQKSDEIPPEEPPVVAESTETPTQETVVAPEDITPPIESQETLEPDPIIETASPIEVQEITVTVEPEISPTIAESTSEDPETVHPEKSSEEILIEPTVIDENLTLKRPNPPNSELNKAEHQPGEPTDSDS